MIRGSKDRCGDWSRSVGLVCGLLWICLPAQSQAICGLDAAAFEQVRDVADLDARQAWARQIARQGGSSCVVCHLDGFGPRNRYGTAINMLVTGFDRENSARKREAGRRVNDIPADPSLPDSPTFGELIRRGILPAADLAANRAALPNLPADPPEEITVERARELVRIVRPMALPPSCPHVFRAEGRLVRQVPPFPAPHQRHPERLRSPLEWRFSAVGAEALRVRPKRCLSTS